MYNFSLQPLKANKIMRVPFKERAFLNESALEN